MTCDCNKPRRRCGVIPVRTCCSNPTVVTRTEFYDYKNNMKTDLDAINRDLADKELKITKLDVEKQNKLLAGQNIILTENADKTVTISSTGGGGSTYTAGDGITIANNEVSVNNTIQRTLTAGTNITITGDTISAQVVDAYTKAETDTLLNAKQDTLTKQDLLDLLGLQEVQIQADDGQGTVRPLTVLGVWDTP